MSPFCVDVNESSHTFDSEHTEPVYQYEEVFLWLLKHLDNPYPSISTKRALCKRSGLVMKAVNEWFSHARRRIGWTSLMKRHFKGDRQLTIDCAHHILVEGSPLYYSDDICQDVENMRDTAERLFAKKSRQSSLSRIFDNRITESVESPRRMSSSFSSQFPPPVSTLAQISLYEEAYIPHVPPRSELASESQNDADPRTTIKKKRARDASDEGQTRFESWRGGPAEASRPVKRLKCVLSICKILMFFKSSNRNLQAPVMKTISRSTSLSTVSSRESTTELLTPPMLTTTLPIAPPFDAINSWMSGFVDGSSSQVSPDSSGCRKRHLSDSTPYELVKKSRNDDFIRDSPKAESGLSAPLILDSSCNIFSQFDFSLPPPATYSSTLHIGEPLQLNSFTYPNGFFEFDVSQNGGCTYLSLLYHLIINFLISCRW